MPSQTVVFSLFDLESLHAKRWAFERIGLSHLLPGRPQLPPRAQWIKLLGSGAGNGFGLRPNLGGYALLAAFPDESAARAALTSKVWRAYAQRAKRVRTLLLRAVTAHGLWDGAEPFETGGTWDPSQPLAVLTRARIRWQHLPAFWRRVAQVSESVEYYPERVFSVGVGELPVVQQATVSVWTSGEAMLDYAYRSAYHKEVVQLTRRQGWYSEELFCRFTVLDAFDSSDAGWPGLSPAADATRMD